MENEMEKKVLEQKSVDEEFEKVPVGMEEEFFEGIKKDVPESTDVKRKKVEEAVKEAEKELAEEDRKALELMKEGEESEQE